MGWSISLGRGGVQTDATLIARCQKADVAAFNEIVGRYKGKIYAYILRMTGSAEDAEDLTQEVFVKMYTSVHTFRAEASVSTWLFRIAGNLCIDAFRRKKVRGTPLSLDAPIENNESDSEGAGREISDSELAPETLLGRKELAGHIEAAISRLPTKLRAAILLHDVEGLAYEEIAEVEKVPLGTVKSRIFNGRVALRESLRPYLEA
jgi:RNA polymerase sigma-70 factor, ECF subfamily